MKKNVCLLLCLVLASALGVPALADVLWMPEDDFYFAHSGECVYSDEGYYAAEETTLWKSPTERRPVGLVAAGESVGTRVIWRDARDHEWGYVEYYRDGGWVQGWLDLTEPTAAPAPLPQSAPVLIAAGVLALAAAGVLFWPRKKEKESN